MKKFRDMLGIVITDKKLALSQVHSDGENLRVVRTAEFNLPESVPLESLSTHAFAFKAFLKGNGFDCKKAVVALPGQFLLSVNVPLPAGCNGSAKNEIVKNTLCRNLQYDLSALAVDYCPNGAGSDSCLAVATLKRYIDEIKGLLAHSGITAVCVTNSSFGAGFDRFAEASCYMVMYPSSADLLFYRKNEFTGLRSLPASKDAAAVGKEISRIPLLYPDLEMPPKLGILDYGAREQSFFANLKTCLQSVQLQQPSGLPGPAICLPLTDLSSGLAQRILVGSPFEINFVNSRVAEEKEGFKVLSYRKVITAVIVLAAVLAVYLYGWYRDHSETAALKAQLDEMSANVKAAKALVGRTAFAKQWFDDSPAYLEMLRELTLQFPMDGQIWLGSLAVDESLNEVITGQAAEEKLVLDVYDNLKNSPRFESVKLLYMRKGTRPTDFVSYAVGFVFVKGN